METFLRDTLKLELSREKTLITHATSQAAKFLGYELVNQQANDKHVRTDNATPTAASAYGFPPKSSNNIASPT